MRNGIGYRELLAVGELEAAGVRPHLRCCCRSQARRDGFHRAAALRVLVMTLSEVLSGVDVGGLIDADIKGAEAGDVRGDGASGSQAPDRTSYLTQVGRRLLDWRRAPRAGKTE
ncbi:hypothetical protein GC169_13520 [bacterium]|nr:hypothetical protein [bacterium]